jgi:hypothetical protein
MSSMLVSLGTYLALHVLDARVLGDGNVRGERGAADLSQREVQHHVFCYRQGFGNSAGCIEFNAMALVVVKRQRVYFVPLLFCQGQARGRVQASGQEDNTALHNRHTH